jgi:hypothetical protein
MGLILTRQAFSLATNSASRGDASAIADDGTLLMLEMLERKHEDLLQPTLFSFFFFYSPSAKYVLDHSALCHLLALYPSLAGVVKLFGGLFADHATLCHIKKKIAA